MASSRMKLIGDVCKWACIKYYKSTDIDRILQYCLLKCTMRYKNSICLRNLFDVTMVVEMYTSVNSELEFLIYKLGSIY